MLSEKTLSQIGTQLSIYDLLEPKSRFSFALERIKIIFAVLAIMIFSLMAYSIIIKANAGQGNAGVGFDNANYQVYTMEDLKAAAIPYFRS